MAFQVIPREQAFFDLLEGAADGVAAGARELAALMADPSQAEARSRRIEELEQAGDELTHQMMALLNVTFVVPMDRQDIYELASLLDDVIDAEEAVADLLVLMKVEPFPRLLQQAEVLVRATGAVARTVRNLRSMDHTDPSWSEIARLEREGDHVYRSAVAEMFSGEHRAMDVLKWKDILEQMEEAIDRCQDIANTIESVVLKHA